MKKLSRQGPKQYTHQQLDRILTTNNKVNDSIRRKNELKKQKSLYMVEIEVQCPKCNAEAFTPCVYVPNQVSVKKNLVGKSIIRGGKLSFHKERKYLQTHVELEHIYSPDALDKLKLWLREYVTILGGDLMDNI